MANTSMLHVRIDEQLKNDAAETLVSVGLAADPEIYDTWFRAKVREALDDTRLVVSHQQVMDDAQALISKKRKAHTCSGSQ